MMKILHVEASKNLYGGARQVQYLIEGLAQRGVSSILACPEGAAVAEVCKPHAIVVEIPWKNDTDVAVSNRLLRIIEEHKVDLIHAHSGHGADWYSLVAAKFGRIPSVISRRVDNPESKLTTKLKYGRADSVIAISEGIARVLRTQGLHHSKLQVIRSAVDTKEYDRHYSGLELRKTFKLPKVSFVIGQIAQLIRRKGHATTLKAFDNVVKIYPNAHLVIFGSGPLEDNLMAMTEYLGLSDNVHFVGFRDDLPQLIGALDLVVHPAIREGLGAPLLQAGAAGVAMIAGNVGGIPEVIIHDETGLLIEPNDSETLTSFIIQLIEDDAQRRLYGQAAKQYINENFSINQMVSENFKNYRRLLGR